MRKYRREPRNLQHFVEIYHSGKRGKPLFDLDEKVRDEISGGKRGLQERVRDVVHSLFDIITTPKDPKPSDGKGFQIFFPLTEARPAGEFVRGALHVLAPKAKVTFLVTPKVAGKDYITEGEQEILEEHVKKSLHPDTKHVRIADWVRQRRTIEMINQALEKTGFKGTVEPNHGYVHPYTLPGERFFFQDTDGQYVYMGNTESYLSWFNFFYGRNVRGGKTSSGERWMNDGDFLNWLKKTDQRVEKDAERFVPKTHLNYPIYASISGNHAEFSENVRRMREIIFGPDDPRAKSDHLTRNDLAEVKRMLLNGELDSKIRELKRKNNAHRRYLYHLGIATAKSYLEMQRKQQAK